MINSLKLDDVLAKIILYTCFKKTKVLVNSCKYGLIWQVQEKLVEKNFKYFNKKSKRVDAIYPNNFLEIAMYWIITQLVNNFISVSMLNQVKNIPLPTKTKICADYNVMNILTVVWNFLITLLIVEQVLVSTEPHLA